MGFLGYSFLFSSLNTFANIFVYFNQSNFAGKIIVVLLIVFSLLAWTVMIGKYFDLNRLRSLNKHFENQLSNTPSILRHLSNDNRSVKGPYKNILSEATKSYYKSRGDPSNTINQINHVENAIQREVAAITITYESKMVLLGSIVTGAPFLGLLGTVWGVMDAFGSIAVGSGANIQMLAPGVSGALLTTVAGLVVAIPSVFGYNFLLTHTKIMMTELENFASSLADRIEIECSETGQD